MGRSYNEELEYLEKIDSHCWRIKKGFVPNMQVCSCKKWNIEMSYGLKISIKPNIAQYSASND